jgi:hypothetical protein
MLSLKNILSSNFTVKYHLLICTHVCELMELITKCFCGTCSLTLGFNIAGPNSTPQNNNARTDRPYSSYSPNQNASATGRNDSQGRPTTTSRIGSNIHTLKHDGDDGRFNDRNSFWNGNSTEYGGNNDDK